MTPRFFLEFLDQTPLSRFNPVSYEPYYAKLAAVSGIDEAHITSLNTVNIALPSSVLFCCPECLATDEIPYIRASWHRKTTFICPVHRALISSVCHVCRQSRVFAPFKIGSTFTPQEFRYCLNPECHSRIEESASGHLPKDHPALWLQQELHHPDLSGLAFIRDGRGIQRRFLSWLFSARLKLQTQDWSLPFDSGQGLVPYWRGATSWVTDSTLTVSQLLQHPAVEDDLILTQLIRQLRWKILYLLRKVSKERWEKHFELYRHSLTDFGAICAFFLVWSEVPVLTAEALATADLERPLRPFLADKALERQKILQVCEAGRHQLLHRLNTER